jgi:hypothetical protein
MASAVDLASNAGTGAGASNNWPGGKTAVVSEGTLTAVDLEVEGPNGGWVVCQSLDTTPFVVLDLPEGNYRVNVTTGSGVYTKLVGIDPV